MPAMPGEYRVPVDTTSDDRPTVVETLVVVCTVLYLRITLHTAILLLSFTVTLSLTRHYISSDPLVP
jgi:hypothetical protein